MRNDPIGYFCLRLYDQWMISETVKLSDLLCIVFGFMVKDISEVVFFLFCLLTIFFDHSVLEKYTSFCGFSRENQPQIHPFSGWVCLSLEGEC